VADTDAEPAAEAEPEAESVAETTVEAETVLEEAQAVIEEAQAEIADAGMDLAEAKADLAEADAVIEHAIEDTLEDEDEDEDYEEIIQLRPGDIEDSYIAVWDSEVAERYRDAWRDIQAHFVDEPEAALSEAQDLVAEAVQALADALIAEQVSLDPHEQDTTPDTEAMRIAMRGYRDFLERVLAL
jgi:hypothetical protein